MQRTPRSFRVLTSTAAFATALLIAGCAAEAPVASEAANRNPAASQQTVQNLLEDNGFAGLDATQIIDRLDETALAQRNTELMASVRPAELVLSDAKQQPVSLPLPEDKFYLSVAPYTGQTHDCHFHSLTTCVGELRNTPVEVTVTDAVTGERLIEGQRTTFDNGFVGLWLPRGIEGTVTITAQGRTATAAISTKGEATATCLTTMQLS